jgi:hypothetical protein
MQPNSVLDKLACFFLGLPLGIATLEGRTNGHKPAILVPLDYHREFVTLHRFKTSDPIVHRLPSADCGLFTPALGAQETITPFVIVALSFDDEPTVNAQDELRRAVAGDPRRRDESNREDCCVGYRLNG